MDADKPYREKARRELHRNVTSDIKEILEAAPHETTAVRLLATHLENHPNKKKETCGTLL